MAKKRTTRKETGRTTNEFSKASEADAEGNNDDFELDDDLDEGADDDFDFDDDLAVKDDDLVDPMLAEDDLEDLEDDDLALGENARFDSFALADDPVRMYLKEIGQVPLLDTNRETWLSIQIAAERLLQEEIDRLCQPEGSSLPSPQELVQALYGVVLRNWADVVQTAKRFKTEPPNLKVGDRRNSGAHRRLGRQRQFLDPRIPASARVGAR